jgi:hypothetical protein
MAKKFPLGRVREIAAHVKNLHECLTDALSEFDAAPAASDNSDRGETWDPARQGQDSAHRRPASTGMSIPGLNRDTSHCK